MFKLSRKNRPELPEEYRKIYAKHYKEHRGGCTKTSSMVLKMESWMHKKVAADIKDVDKSIPTLEIGAGTLNHLPYEKDVKPYDIVEPFKELFSESDQLVKIRNAYSDISEIPVGQKYERIISIATLEHIVDLQVMVARAGLLLTEAGHFRIGIPNEGALLWKLGWKLTSGLEFRLRYNLDYGVLMRYEHVNTANEIEGILKYFFSSVRHEVFGLNKTFSLYRFFDCSCPYEGRCSGTKGRL